MDERIDLTQNRDFRHRREPRFKDAHFFNIDNNRPRGWDNLRRKISKRLENGNKEIIVRDGCIYVEKSYNIIDHKNKIITCDRCGRKFISLSTYLCDKCNAEMTMELNRQFDTFNIVNTEAELAGINETGTEFAEQLIEDFLNEE